MRALIAGTCLVALVFGAAPALAKKKKKLPIIAETKKGAKDEGAPLPPPNDKRTNDGAQGRKNATEDAVKAAEGEQRTLP